ncbi:colicin immunity domain-containing protein [Streptomyces sp. NPDC058685]|uniref:colicin immunity domain-containing protein n=1 Tax=Streptomyces sp. NPDC058685 TaxID=3346598 RepID=UPI003655C17C
MNNFELIESILSPSQRFRSDWLAVSTKSLAPVPDHSSPSPATAGRVVSGSREVGAVKVLASPLNLNLNAVPVAEMPLDAEELLGVAVRIRCETGLLLVAENFLGAALIRPGYALFAGSSEFMRGAVPEGIASARTNFLRYAQKVEDRRPDIMEVATNFPPANRSWKSAAEVPDRSHTGRQLALMGDLASNTLDGPTFARQWLAARRDALNIGERLGAALTNALDEVFYTLEEYVIDPSLRDEDDMSDEDLRRRVADIAANLP